jgi:protease-4
MLTERRGVVRTVLGGLWWLVDGARRVFLNLLFLLILGGALFAWFTGGPSKLRDRTVLVLNLSGPIVEQRSGSARDVALKKVRGEDADQTRLRDVLAVLDAAAKDTKIERVLLILDELSGGGLSAQREVAAAIDRFKASGKQVVAWGTRWVPWSSRATGACATTIATPSTAWA